MTRSQVTWRKVTGPLRQSTKRLLHETNAVLKIFVYTEGILAQDDKIYLVAWMPNCIVQNGKGLTMSKINADMDTVKSLMIRAIERRGYKYEMTDRLIVDEGPEIPGDGVSDGLTKTVKILNSLSDWFKLRTTAHELAHVVLGHPTPTYDNFLNSLSRYSKNVREIDAETTAYGVLVAFGLEDGHVTADYIRSWAQGMHVYNPDLIDISTAEKFVPWIVAELVLDSFFSNFARDEVYA